jgi:tRNA dimethylallyltransferase
VKRPDRELVAVVGATATGKTALAIALARALDGEIVNADSRQVYRGMDIGTAKPTVAEQAAARHWLIDVATPDEPFTLASYLETATGALDDVDARGRRAIVAGGTGQYIWALLEGWRVPRVAPDPELRRRLETLADTEGAAAVVEELRAVDPASASAIDARNVRRVIRAIEVSRATGKPFSEWREKGPPRPATIIGLALPRRDLHRRIDARIDGMMAAGLVGEVRGLTAAGYGCDLPAMSGIGYGEICEHLSGACSLDDAVRRIKTQTHRLARMQHTWFSPDDARITWLRADDPTLVQRSLDLLAAPSRREGPAVS